MRLGPDDQRMQPGVTARIELFLGKYFKEPPEVAGDGVRHGGAEVAHQLDLPLAVTGPGRDREAAQPFDAVLEAQPAGK